jgi:hypothetical protein
MNELDNYFKYSQRAQNSYILAVASYFGAIITPKKYPKVIGGFYSMGTIFTIYGFYSFCKMKNP